jgi:hypothetical protein
MRLKLWDLRSEGEAQRQGRIPERPTLKSLLDGLEKVSIAMSLYLRGS